MFSRVFKSGRFFWITALFPFIWLVGGLLILKNFELPAWLEFFNSDKAGKAIFATVWLGSIALHIITRLPGINEYLKRHFPENTPFMVTSCTVLGFVLYAALYLIGFLTLFQVTGMLLTVCGLGGETVNQ